MRLSTRVQGIPRFAPAFSRTRLNHSVACHPAIKAHPNESAEASATAVHRPLRFRSPHHRCGRTPIAQNVARNLVGRCCLTIRPDNRSASARNGHCGLRRWWYREHRRTRCRRKECNAHCRCKVPGDDGGQLSRCARQIRISENFVGPVRVPPPQCRPSSRPRRTSPRSGFRQLPSRAHAMSP